MAVAVAVLAGTVRPSAEARAADPSGVDDARQRPGRTLYDPYHPWTPPADRAAWDELAGRLREQTLVACGLWPLPEKTPLEPVIHGRIDRGDYTVERVSFASQPGVYVTGSLYRPAAATGRVPGVLCPHGHWANGRFYDAGEGEARKQLEAGAEEFPSGARFPLQARMVQLARMGCVVFHYDMIGYADDQAIPHRAGFNDADASLWLHNKLGLQTWNSIRALDFLESLPDVDPRRLAATGASGGGTQTFLLCAVDPRPAVAFPAVMVGTGMQGGCVCENADYLRQDINNIALAALCAPRPMAMTGADDWTKDIESRGLPELKQVYSFFGAADLVEARAFLQFGHNYNQVSREVMYAWFNRHLDLRLPEPVKEREFEPLSVEELHVFNDAHPRPADALNAEDLREKLRERDRRTFLAVRQAGPARFREVIGTAARVLLQPPDPQAVRAVRSEDSPTGGQIAHWRAEYAGTRAPFTLISAGSQPGRVVLWLDEGGALHLLDNGQPEASVRQLLDAGISVASADLFEGTLGEDGKSRFNARLLAAYPGFVYGYNRPLLTEQARDVLAVVAALKSLGAESVELVGTGSAGLPTLLARAASSGAEIARTRVDVEGFSFAQVQSNEDLRLLPGVLKYGDVGGLATLAAGAGGLWLHRPDSSSAAGLRELESIWKQEGRGVWIEPAELDRAAVVEGVRAAE